MSDDNDEIIVKDSNGTRLTDGDSVTLIKDLKVKGTSVTLKRGQLCKNIRLTDDEDLIECNVDKVKGLVLRTEFIKTACGLKMPPRSIRGAAAVGVVFDHPQPSPEFEIQLKTLGMLLHQPAWRFGAWHRMHDDVFAIHAATSTYFHQITRTHEGDAFVAHAGRSRSGQ